VEKEDQCGDDFGGGLAGHHSQFQLTMGGGGNDKTGKDRKEGEKRGGVAKGILDHKPRHLCS